jgi:hypothetical protein
MVGEQGRAGWARRRRSSRRRNRRRRKGRNQAKGSPLVAQPLHEFMVAAAHISNTLATQSEFMVRNPELSKVSTIQD